MCAHNGELFKQLKNGKEKSIFWNKIAKEEEKCWNE